MTIEEVRAFHEVRNEDGPAGLPDDLKVDGKMHTSKSKNDLLSALTRAYSAARVTNNHPQDALEQCLSSSKNQSASRQSAYPPLSRKLFPGLYKGKHQAGQVAPAVHHGTQKLPAAENQPARRSSFTEQQVAIAKEGQKNRRSHGGRLEQLKSEHRSSSGRRWSDSFKDGLKEVFGRKLPPQDSARKGSDPDAIAARTSGNGNGKNSALTNLLDNIFHKKSASEGPSSVTSKDQIRDGAGSRDPSVTSKGGMLSPLHRLRSMRRSSSTSITEMPKKSYPWRVTELYPLIPEQLYFTAHLSESQTWQEIKKRPDLYFFSCDLQDNYMPFCSDFGPVNLAIVYHFWQYVKSKKQNPGLAGRPMVYYCDMTPESRTNTAFLLGSYLMLEHGYSADAAMSTFMAIRPYPFMNFHDATFAQDTFKLSLRDCLRGFEQGLSVGWFDKHDFDVNNYCKLEHPLGGDISVVCHKFVAFKGPVTNEKCLLPGEWANPPSFFVDQFKKMGVTAVVRLNEPETYDAQEFEKEGIKVHDLWFRDCSVPSFKLVEKFLDICKKEPGMIAVHCKAGLGRTGTMIGLWLMQNYGFTARDSIGWMRIIRPGMVIGPQQMFLEDCEQRVWNGNEITNERKPTRMPPSPTSRRGASVSPRDSDFGRAGSAPDKYATSAESDKLAMQLAKAMHKRSQEIMDQEYSSCPTP